MIKKAFTLTELIVVITILAILATIAFIAFNGYAKDARDSIRINDIKTIETSLELYNTKQGKYPVTTNPVDITFSGAILWQEGTFGNDTKRITGNLDIIPTDPITFNEYTYSITNNKLEYQLGFALETGGIFSKKNNNHIINQANAGVNSLRTSISGNYNGKVLLVSTGGLDYVLAIPSIITSNNSNGNIIDILSNKDLTFKGYSNLPSSYKSDLSELDYGNFNFSQLDSVVFKGNFDDLNNQDTRLLFYRDISDVYIYSELEGEPGYTGFSAGYIDKFNPTFDYVNIACLKTEELMKKDYGCLAGVDQVEDIVQGEAFTGLLLDDGETNYVGQWHFGDSSGKLQSLGSANHERSSMGMYGGLNKSIGVKWKMFTSSKEALTYYGGYDINNDGNENMLYAYGGRLFLGDINTGAKKWQTKVLDIKQILGVESILADGTKSIIVALGTDRYIGVINGANGNLDWVSNSASGPVKAVKVSWPKFDYKIFDINGDGINEYHFKQRYDKYHSYKFFESGGKVIGETLWASEGYGDYNEGTSDGYQVNSWSMGTLSGKLVVGTKGANTFSFYSNDVNSGLSGIDAFKMPAFGKLYTSAGNYNGWKDGKGYFYDLNGDGNDEYISRIDEELNNNKLSRLFVSGLSSTGSMVQYMSLSNPKTLDASGSLTSYGDFSTPIALKNNSDLEDSYILSKGRSPDDGTDKWMMFKYRGLEDAGFKKSSNENESFNYDIVYDKFDTSYTVSGIYNNGNKDYIVLYKSGKFYFYTFNGVDTFLNGSSLEVTGSFFGNTIFDNGYDIRREKNKNAGVFMASYDTNGNGIKEFVVADGGYYKFYEVEDSGVTLLKSYGPYTSISGVKKWGLTSDNKDIYAINYTSSNNTINYYRTNSASNDFTFSKITSDNFYSGGAIREMEITTLGTDADKYNKVMIKHKGMYDARDATPSSPPIKIGEFMNSYDMDRDGENEVFISDNAYTYNSPGNYTKKYNYTGWVGDLNGDGVLDKAWAYCAPSENFINNIYYTLRSGIDGSQIVPDIDYGNGNGWCSGGNTFSNVSEDFDGDGIDEIAIGANRLATRLISLSGSTASGFTVNEGNIINKHFNIERLAAFDFDGDGIKEIIRAHDRLEVYKGDSNNKTSLTSTPIVSMNPNIKSTWGKGLGLPSLYRYNNITYAAFRGIDGEVALMSWDGTTVKTLFHKYFLDTTTYNNSEEILNHNLIPLESADVLLGDFMGSGDVQVLVGGGDGYLYIVSIDGVIIRAFDIGVAIKRMIIGDTNGDLLVDILLSAEDGYIYQVGTSRIRPPVYVKDGNIAGTDINTQDETQEVGVNFARVDGASGYFVQLYNYTSDAIVFDWLDVGTSTSLCINSANYTDENCISLGINFDLTKGSVYQWRVQSYNEEISSPTVLSNGFYINE